MCLTKKKQLNHIQIEAVTEILKPLKLLELLYNIFSKLKVEKYCWSCWNQLQSARFIQQIRSVYLIFQGLEGPHNGVALLLLASWSGLLLWEETTVLSYQITFFYCHMWCDNKKSNLKLSFNLNLLCKIIIWI